MNKQFFTGNRQNLFNLLEDKSIVILCAGKAPIKSADEDYKFTPNRNFYYLTGINEDRDILVLIKDGSIKDELLIINKYDELRKKWVGKTYTADEATELSGVNNVDYFDAEDTVLSNIIKSLSGEFNVYIDKNALVYDALLKNIEKKYFSNTETKDVFPLIRQLRMVKQQCEIDKIIKANQLTKNGLELVMRNLKPGLIENQVEAHFDYSIKCDGATGFAFGTIAAAGVNACVLHYDQNNTKINDGDLVLFDLGAEWEYYKSDISRTFPANGKYSDRQKELYNMVLSAQQLVIDNAKPGLTTKDLNEMVIKHYEVELLRLGVIKDASEVKNYYYHGVSHHMGLDTHDVAVVQPLEAGNIITVEPGIYIEEEKIGIRIEDDILITNGKAINLSEGIIKSVEEIEKFMSK
ncbi:MAG: Xaa-Pro aminopeptidase [bacterium]